LAIFVPYPRPGSGTAPNSARHAATTAATCHRPAHSLNGDEQEHIMKILMVLTSHDQLGNTGRKTGF
jgi:hypothetical protein